MRVLKKINSGLMTFIKAVLIAFGTLMTVLVIMNVILRYVFHSGISWSEEACRFLFIWVTFLGAILTNDAGLHGEHMRMDFIVEMFRGIPRKIVEVIAMLLMLLMLGTLFVGGVELVKGTWPMLTSALRIPKGAVYLCAPIGFGYLFLQTLAKLLRIITASSEELENEGKESKEAE